MGCKPSREEDNRSLKSAPYSSGLTPPEAVPLMPSMGHPTPAASSSGLSSQHERLILELLPLKDARQFQEWLQGPYVRGSWHEYCRDFFARNPTSPECDKQKTAQAAKDAIGARNPKYLLYHPEKDGWTPEDHVVRFIVSVVNDNMLKGIWSESDWRKRNIDIAKAVYEVLSYLRSTDFGSQAPPGYEHSMLH